MKRGGRMDERELLRDGRYAEYQYRHYVSKGWMPKWVPKLNDHRVVAMTLRISFMLTVCIVGGTLGAFLAHLIFR